MCCQCTNVVWLDLERHLTCPAFTRCTTAAVTRSSSPGSMLSCMAVIRSYKVVTMRIRPGACPSKAVLSWSTATGMILPPVLAHVWGGNNMHEHWYHYTSAHRGEPSASRILRAAPSL